MLIEIREKEGKGIELKKKGVVTEHDNVDWGRGHGATPRRT
jgi:hypothetical protein